MCLNLKRQNIIRLPTKISRFPDRKILNGSVARDIPTSWALRYKRKLTDIYSNSWGPSDNGHLVNGPGPMVKRALQQGVKEVRLHYFKVYF